jgi:hypothetical protein
MVARQPISLVRAAILVTVAAVVIAAAGCGGDEETTRFGDDKIVDTLDLQKSDGGYAIGGDPFCEVDSNLLNDADEVDKAKDRNDLNLMLASHEGNVGVIGVPPFAPDCRQKAERQLNKLDPKPKAS